MSFLSKLSAKADKAGFTPEINKQIAMLIVGTVCAAAMLTPEIAMASGTSPSLSAGQSVGAISGNIKTSLSGAAQVVTAMAYLGAVFFAFIGILKWKAHAEQPDRTALKVPVTYMAIGAMCAALPEVIGTGIGTLWGSTAQTVQAI